MSRAPIRKHGGAAAIGVPAMWQASVILCGTEKTNAFVFSWVVLSSAQARARAKGA